LGGQLGQGPRPRAPRRSSPSPKDSAHLRARSRTRRLLLVLNRGTIWREGEMAAQHRLAAAHPLPALREHLPGPTPPAHFPRSSRRATFDSSRRSRRAAV
jgi:hypothetical protein